MSLLILVVDDEPDVETLFRQRFRRDLRGEAHHGVCPIRRAASPPLKTGHYESIIRSGESFSR